MLPELKQLLHHLEETLHPGSFAHIESLHCAALEWQAVPRLPLIVMFPYPEEAEFQPFPHRQIFDDPEKMLFNQLVSAFDSSLCLSNQVGDDLPAAIRPDFGCVLIPSMFGARVEQVGDNPPWVRHDHQKAVSHSQIMNTDPSDFSLGWIPRVVSRYRFYHDILDEYPNLSAIVNITLPDLQGPFDNLELIRGSEIFLDMYLQKALFLEAMRVVTKAQLELAGYLSRYTHEQISGVAHQHNFPFKGRILIRSDTAIMVSSEMYREMISPFDEMILKSLGGGIHSCGEVNRIIAEFLSLDGISCFDFGQSELNDVEAIYVQAKEKKIALTRIAVSEQVLANGAILEKYPTGMSLLFRAASLEQARHVVNQYKQTYGRTNLFRW